MKKNEIKLIGSLTCKGKVFLKTLIIFTSWFSLWWEIGFLCQFLSHEPIQSACHVTLQARTKLEVGDWDMSFSLFWHWWKNAFTCGSCKGNRSVYLWWYTDSERGWQALLSTIPQEIRLRAPPNPPLTERSTEGPQVTTALWMMMPAHFILSFLIPLALLENDIPWLPASLLSFLLSLLTCLPAFLSFPLPSLPLFLPFSQWS